MQVSQKYLGKLSGKATLIGTLANTDNLSHPLLPVEHDLCTFSIEVDGRSVIIELWNTIADDEPDRARSRLLGYHSSAVVVLCLAIDAPQSLQTTREKWYPEILHFTSGIPLLLVGCKSDIRERSGVPGRPGQGKSIGLITPNQGSDLALEVGALAYLECSVIRSESIAVIRETLGRVALSWDPAASNELEKRQCTVV